MLSKPIAFTGKGESSDELTFLVFSLSIILSLSRFSLVAILFLCHDRQYALMNHGRRMHYEMNLDTKYSSSFQLSQQELVLPEETVTELANRNSPFEHFGLSDLFTNQLPVISSSVNETGR